MSRSKYPPPAFQQPPCNDLPISDDFKERHSAIVIQRAFRRHALDKSLEKLRHERSETGSISKRLSLLSTDSAASFSTENTPVSKLRTEQLATDSVICSPPSSNRSSDPDPFHDLDFDQDPFTVALAHSNLHQQVSMSGKAYLQMPRHSETATDDSGVNLNLGSYESALSSQNPICGGVNPYSYVSYNLHYDQYGGVSPMPTSYYPVQSTQQVPPIYSQNPNGAYISQVLDPSQLYHQVHTPTPNLGIYSNSSSNAPRPAEPPCYECAQKRIIQGQSHSRTACPGHMYHPNSVPNSHVQLQSMQGSTYNPAQDIMHARQISAPNSAYPQMAQQALSMNGQIFPQMLQDPSLITNASDIYGNVAYPGALANYQSVPGYHPHSYSGYPLQCNCSACMQQSYSGLAALQLAQNNPYFCSTHEQQAQAQAALQQQQNLYQNVQFSHNATPYTRSSQQTYQSVPAQAQARGQRGQGVGGRMSENSVNDHTYGGQSQPETHVRHLRPQTAQQLSQNHSQSQSQSHSQSHSQQNNTNRNANGSTRYAGAPVPLPLTHGHSSTPPLLPPKHSDQCRCALHVHGNTGNTSANRASARTSGATFDSNRSASSDCESDAHSTHSQPQAVLEDYEPEREREKERENRNGPVSGLRSSGHGRGSAPFLGIRGENLGRSQQDEAGMSRQRGQGQQFQDGHVNDNVHIQKLSAAGANGNGNLHNGNNGQQMHARSSGQQMHSSNAVQRPPAHSKPTGQQAQLSKRPPDALRKRKYRVGLNLFNRKPMKGIDFLIANRFVANDTVHVAQFLLTRKGLSRSAIGDFFGSNIRDTFIVDVLRSFISQIDLVRQPIDEALRRFQSYFRLPGEAQVIEKLVEVFADRYVHANLPNGYLEREMRLASASGTGTGNSTNPSPNPVDSVLVLAFAVILLNTDLHNPNVKQEKRMKLEQFVRNLRGVDGGQDPDRALLEQIYERIRVQPLQPNPDHVSQVVKLERQLVGRHPPLSAPTRRLVCYCRLYDVGHEQSPVSDLSLFSPSEQGSLEPRLLTLTLVGNTCKQREVFLFNDLLLVCKILNKRKNRIMYKFKAAFSLYNLRVCLFESQNCDYGLKIQGYQVKAAITAPGLETAAPSAQNALFPVAPPSNPTAAKNRALLASESLFLAEEPETLLLNARNAEDRDQFLDDLREGIAETVEMVTAAPELNIVLAPPLDRFTSRSSSSASRPDSMPSAPNSVRNPSNSPDSGTSGNGSLSGIGATASGSGSGSGSGQGGTAASGSVRSQSGSSSASSNSSGVHSNSNASSNANIGNSNSNSNHVANAASHGSDANHSPHATNNMNSFSDSAISNRPSSGSCSGSGMTTNCSASQMQYACIRREMNHDYQRERDSDMPYLPDSVEVDGQFEAASAITNSTAPGGVGCVGMVGKLVKAHSSSGQNTQGAQAQTSTPSQNSKQVNRTISTPAPPPRATLVDNNSHSAGAGGILRATSALPSHRPAAKQESNHSDSSASLSSSSNTSIHI